MSAVETTPVASTAVRRDRVFLAAVLLGVAVVAGLLYWRFLDQDRQLWVNSSHDRNAHQLFALTLAEAVRHGRLFVLLRELNGARVWGPLYGLLAALVMAVGGFDYRLAVLPSLAGWALTAVFAFLTARRAAPRRGNLAGLTALLFVLAAPVHRGYATDVMLESLGAGLTLVTLYCYLVAVQERTVAAGRWLGLALTLLFLEKYNYWLIVVFALVGATLPDLLHRYGPALRTWLGRLEWRALLRREAVRPSTWMILAVVVASAVIYQHGDQPFVLAGHTVSLFPPYNVLQIAYVVFFLRFVFWWRHGGRETADRMESPWRPLLRWHVWPGLWWMLAPKHLGCFVWYLSPANAPKDGSKGLLSGLEFYGPRALTYHASLTCAVVAVVLFLLAVTAVRRLRPGAAAVLLCCVLGAAMTVNHPNHQARYLYSWMATLWIGAGVGLVVLLPRRRVLSLGIGGLALAGLTWLSVPGLPSDRPAPDGGPQPDRASLLELTDFYGGDLETAHKAVVLTEMPFRFAARWTALERRPEPDWFDCIECYRGGFGPPWMWQRQGMLDWLTTCDCDTLVSIEDEGTDTGYWEWINQRGRLYEALSVLLREQGRYHAVKRQEFPRHGCVITVWKREAPPGN